jgi:hypothetical protein
MWRTETDNETYLARYPAGRSEHRFHCAGHCAEGESTPLRIGRPCGPERAPARPVQLLVAPSATFRTLAPYSNAASPVHGVPPGHLLIRGRGAVGPGRRGEERRSETVRGFSDAAAAAAEQQCSGACGASPRSHLECLRVQRG